MKKILPLIIIAMTGCNQQFLVDCDDSNYFISPNENLESGFTNKQREIATTLSEKELNKLFGQTNMSCKYILANFFYCNICFNNETNYLISYNGTQFELNNINDPTDFTNHVISLISSMKIGSEEYTYFLNAQKNSLSKKETKLLEHYFKTEKKDATIKSIMIKTH